MDLCETKTYLSVVLYEQLLVNENLNTIDKSQSFIKISTDLEHVQMLRPFSMIKMQEKSILRFYVIYWEHWEIRSEASQKAGKDEGQY